MQIFQKLDYTADAVALMKNLYVCAFSRKEGNIWDGCLALVNHQTSQYLETSTSSGIEALSILQNSNVIITGGDDGCIRLYGNELSLESSISAHDDVISTFSLNETNQQLISGSWDGTCCLWNFGEGNFTHVSSFLAHSGPVHDFTSQEQSPNICCSIGQDGFIRIWDFRQSGMNNSQSNCISLASLNQIGSSCSWSSSNPNHIICGLEDGNILSFDIRFSSSHDAAPTINYSSNLPIHTSRIERILTSSSLPVDGYISASSDGCIAFVSMSDNSSPKYSKCSNDRNSFPTDLCWSDSPSHIVSSWSDGTIRLLDIESFTLE